jgi:AcrR family transcriptional regulator
MPNKPTNSRMAGLAPRQMKRRASPALSEELDRRRQQSKASIQRAINGTIDLIAEEGLASVTIQRVAEQSGSSNALIVFHFKNKENLLQAVLQYVSEHYDELWTRLVRTGDTPERKLRGAILCAQQFAHDHPKWVSVFIAFSADRKSLRLYRKVALPSDRLYIAEARQLLAEIAAAGRYDSVNIDVLNEGLNYLIHGAWLWDHLNPRKGKSDNLSKMALALLRQAFPRHFRSAD